MFSKKVKIRGWKCVFCVPVAVETGRALFSSGSACWILSAASPFLSFTSLPSSCLSFCPSSPCPCCLSGYCHLQLICRPLPCENWGTRGREGPVVVPVMLKAPVEVQLWMQEGLWSSSHIWWGSQIWTWHLEHTLLIVLISREFLPLCDWMGLVHHLCLPLWCRKVMFKVAQVTWGYLRTWGTSPTNLNKQKFSLVSTLKLKFQVLYGG